ncbi:MAG: hypothetical protein Kow00127_25330 [Bacteroidales bacterium]
MLCAPSGPFAVKKTHDRKPKVPDQNFFKILDLTFYSMAVFEPENNNYHQFAR